MSKQILVALCCLIAILPARAACAQATPPSTDIYLVQLRLVNGAPRLGTPVNITNRPGYDNQPSFTPDSKAILFTSVRADAQADIYRYDLASKTTTRITSTPESEYSATVFGDGTRFSAIRVEGDSTQRLWTFRLDGSDPRVLFPAIKPVGYHAWVDSTTVAMFLLGRPNALVLADIRGGAADTVARDVGRSLLPLPKGHGFSFFQHAKDSSWILTAVDIRGSGRDRRMVSMPLVRMPQGADYIAWIAPVFGITGSGSRLLIWRGSEKEPEWTQLADLTNAGLSHISRVALSPDHRWLAIVAEPKR
jgi:hypothetical protein